MTFIRFSFTDLKQLCFPNCSFFHLEFQSPLQLHVRASRTTGTNLGDAVFNVDLIVYRVSAAVTGTYICRSVNNAHKSSELHIFAQGKRDP